MTSKLSVFQRADYQKGTSRQFQGRISQALAFEEECQVLSSQLGNEKGKSKYSEESFPW